MDDTTALNCTARFEFYRLRFHFEAQGAIQFPPAIPANILRGAFGSIFRRIACVPECMDARVCERRTTCAYARTFEPSAIGPGPSGLANWPRPFVFRAAHLDGRAVAPGDQFHFDAVLFQLRDPPIPDFVRAFAELAHEGLGPGRGRATLERVEQVDLNGASSELSAVGNTPSAINLDAGRRDGRSIAVRFATPTELKSGPGLAVRPEFAVLLARIRDRLSTLAALYGRGPLEIDFAALAARAAAVRIRRCELRQVRAERLSSRTGQRHPLGGFVGWVEYEGNLAEFVPFLTAARFTGVGRQTSWGKGEIHVQLSPEFAASCIETCR